MSSVLTEFAVSSDMIIVRVRRACRCLKIVCECTCIDLPTDNIRPSCKTVRFAVSTYIVHGVKLALW